MGLSMTGAILLGNVVAANDVVLFSPAVGGRRGGGCSRSRLRVLMPSRWGLRRCCRLPSLGCLPRLAVVPGLNRPVHRTDRIGQYLGRVIEVLDTRFLVATHPTRLVDRSSKCLAWPVVINPTIAGRQHRGSVIYSRRQTGQCVITQFRISRRQHRASGLPQIARMGGEPPDVTPQSICP